jgi:hypothetical protein
MPRKERALLADDAALVPRNSDRTEDGKKFAGHGITSCPPCPPFFGLTDSCRISRAGTFCRRVSEKRAFAESQSYFDLKIIGRHSICLAVATTFSVLQKG